MISKNPFFILIYVLTGLGVAFSVWTLLLVSENLMESKDVLFVLSGLVTLFLFLNIPRKYNRRLASVKMAGLVLISIALILSVGTFLEAQHGAFYAQKKLYHSPQALLVWVFLAVILIAVMRDRLPWKKKHISFLTAHVGLIMLMLGSLVTERYGLDGVVSLSLNDKAEKQWIVLPQKRKLAVYASLDGQNLREIQSEPVNFIRKSSGLKWDLGENVIEVLDYIHHAQKNFKIIDSEDKRQLPAIQFELQNERVHFLKWVRLKEKRGIENLDLGPAQVTWVSEKRSKEIKLIQKPHLILKPLNKTKISYEIRNKNKVKKGILNRGQTLDTGWMGLKFRAVKYYPHAQEKNFYEEVPFQGKGPFSAIKLKFNNQEHWLGLDSVLRVFTDHEMFYITYSHQKTPMPFQVKIKDFLVKKYPGTQMDASYESLVQVEGFEKPSRIHMNNPLKHKGLTFYQASFEKNKEEEVVASILSVNYDPGRWLKYYGSFLVILGSVFLFYFRRKFI